MFIVYFRERNNALERNLPNLKFALQQQKLALEDIQTYIADRDKQMQEEMAIILGHVKSSCELEVQGWYTVTLYVLTVC